MTWSRALNTSSRLIAIACASNLHPRRDAHITAPALKTRNRSVPWANQSGGPKGPWGQGPAGGGNGVRPPDLETLLKRAFAEIRRYIPIGSLGRGGMTVAGLAVLGLWLLSGIYTVDPHEQGVVLRFGRFIGHTANGMHYHLPWPIETVYTPDVTDAKQINIGYKINDNSNPTQSEDNPSESLMLTGDENIVDMHFTVFWRIKDANSYLFNISKPDDTVKAVAESAMREVVGQDRMDLIMTSDREQIQRKVKWLMQQTLDSYNAGIEVTEVTMQMADPPLDVRDAYLDVQKAVADQDRKRSEAEAYANTIIPQARGDAAHIVQDAEAFRQQAIAEATGNAQKFLSVYQQYKKAPEVTRRRMYLETMSQILAPMNKVIVDDSAKGVVPYFQLPQMQKPAPPPPRNQQQPTPQASTETVVATPDSQGSGP
ncbi:MAG: FtsH protease activity modulator HflK [Alphaproteobacteria bacterium]|nr:FtsH protease activity modulator HflK [Alphaproteobacteria bacterium]